MHREPDIGIESEVVGLLEIGRPVVAVVTMRRPAGPRAARHVDLVENEPLGIERRCENVIDLTQGGTSPSQFALHLRRVEDPRGEQPLRRCAPEGELESLVGHDLQGCPRRDVGDAWHLVENIGTSEDGLDVADPDRCSTTQRHDRSFLIGKMGRVARTRTEVDQLEAEMVPACRLRGDFQPDGAVGIRVEEM